MPNIINKPFALENTACYKCGNLIEKGSVNWSYNTRSAGKFAHRNCNGSVIAPTTNQPKETSQDEELTPLNDDIPSDLPIIKPVDITDKIKISGKHWRIALIKIQLELRKYPFMHGAPGAGKTHLAQTIAEDMELDFLPISCSQDMFKGEILGNNSPVTGDYFPSAFRKLWEFGGVILYDETGLANGNFLNILNCALSQEVLTFPDGRVVKIHKNCFIMFADNSTLHGDDPMFPERQDAGQAFRDRIGYVKFDYDLKIERFVIELMFQNDTARAAKWHEAVKGMRQAVEALKVPIFVSPRFAYSSAEYFTRGVDFDTVLELSLFEGLADTDPDMIRRVEAAVAPFKGRY